MRKLLIVCSLLLVAMPLAAARPALESGDGVSNWVTFARTSPAQLAHSAETARAAVSQGVRPAVLLETNSYTFEPAEVLNLRVSLDPMGYTSPVTLYLAWQDRTTGAKRYYNIPADGFLPAGQAGDLFGQPGSPVPVNPPTFQDFVLFGSASDPADTTWATAGAIGPSTTVPSGQTGMYQWVMEIRDASGRFVISRSNAMVSYVNATVPVAGEITSDTTWTADNRYVLSDFVAVTNDAVLTIEPGAVIYGGDSRATLFITRGAKIMAAGTNLRPIVFTSPHIVGERAQRDWGGLLIFGRAPVNEAGGEAVMEGLPNDPKFTFGGSDPHDSSGRLSYLRLEFGGFEIAVDQEINAFTPGGVGDGTQVDHLQVLFNKDDAVEPFGGTLNMKYLLFMGYADDGLDGDLGWQGKAQFVVNIKSNINDEGDGNVAFEWDNHPQNFDLQPRTRPMVYNLTAVGTGSTTEGAYGGVLRRGASCDLHNWIIMGTRKAPLTIRDDSSFNEVDSGLTVIDNSILFGDFSDAAYGSKDDPQRTRDFLFTTMTHNRNIDPMLAFGAWSPSFFMMPDVAPLPGSPALDANFTATPPDDGFFDTSVDFVGGVGPDHNWVLDEWTNFSDN